MSAAHDQSHPIHVENSAENLHFLLKGMHCTGCANRAKQVLEEVSGVALADVHLATESVDLKGTGYSIEEIAAAMETAGFETNLKAKKTTLLDEIIMPVGSGRAAALAVALALSFIISMIPSIHQEIPAPLKLVLSGLIVFWLGWPVLAGGWAALRSRIGNMDLLVSIGAGTAFVFSTVQFIRGEDALYFDAAAIIVAFVLLGKWLEARAKRHATSSLTSLMSMKPEVALLLTDQGTEEKSVYAINVGDRVLVKTGERAPVDGVVVSGETELDTSHLTGESEPSAIGEGARVAAGALNLVHAIEVEATAKAKDSAIERIIKLVESAEAGKAPIQKLVDRVSAIFVPLVLAIAAITFIGWLVTGATLEQAILPAVAVLVIACPCALGLATPTALVAGVGTAAKHGIIIRNLDVLEAAPKIDTALFDKTGTLTEGHPEVLKFEAANDAPADLLQLVTGIQARSEHVLAKAFMHYADNAGVTPYASEEVKTHIGEGLEGISNGRKIAIGNHKLMARLGIDLPDGIDTEVAGTLVTMAVDGAYAGYAIVKDPMRKSAPQAMADLKKEGVAPHLASGDRKSNVEATAKLAGIENFHGEMAPADKSDLIEKLQGEDHKVLMVGDGINDAPALALADFSVAMGSGTDVAVETADVTLMNTDPSLVAASLHIARATRRKIYQNLGWAFIYNVIGLPLAALGILPPAFAAAAMALSSVSVVSNSVLLTWWKPNLESTS